MYPVLKIMHSGMINGTFTSSEVWSIGCYLFSGLIKEFLPLQWLTFGALPPQVVRIRALLHQLVWICDGIKPQVHGSTDVVIKEYRSDRELWIELTFNNG